MSIAVALKHMLAAGMPHDAIVAAIEEMEAEAPRKQTKGAARQQRYRERHKASQVTISDYSDDSDASLSPLDPPSLPPKPPITSPLNPPTPSISVGRKRPTPSEFFQRFKTEYPKREGANPWQPALKSFNREVAAGADPEAIILGAQHYRASQSGKDARFVAQAVTWLNQQRWTDHLPTVSLTAPPCRPVVARLSKEEVERQVRAFGLIP